MGSAIIGLMLSGESLAEAGSVLFRDDFSLGTLDRQQWSYATWTLGRTHFGTIPLIEDGVLHITFDTDRFQGTEVYTQRDFVRGSGVEFRVRAKLGHYPPGLVTAFFTYKEDAAHRSDEIDLEILSKVIRQSEEGAPVWLSTWHDWDPEHLTDDEGLHHFRAEKQLNNFDYETWHEYTIRWLPGETVWLVDDVFVGATRRAQPLASVPFRISLWAPDTRWQEAYSSELMPGNARDHEVYELEVDWVEVRRIPAS